MSNKIKFIKARQIKTLIIVLIITLLATSFLIACDSAEKADQPTPEKEDVETPKEEPKEPSEPSKDKATEPEPTEHETVNNFEDVTMRVDESTITPQGLKLRFENDSGSTGIYSDDFVIEEDIDGKWYKVPTIVEEYGFNDIGYDLPSKETGEWKVEWDWLYGSLKPGKYRIIKSILDFEDTGEFETYYLAEEFEIK